MKSIKVTWINRGESVEWIVADDAAWDTCKSIDDQLDIIFGGLELIKETDQRIRLEFEKYVVEWRSPDASLVQRIFEALKRELEERDDVKIHGKDRPH